MAADPSTSLPELDLAPTATISVDTGNPAAKVSQLVIYGTYYPPAAPDPETKTPEPLFLPVALSGP